MECKYYLPAHHTTLTVRINRYIMECKFRKTGGYQKQLSRINRYIMECKFVLKAFHLNVLFELIDTLWNVNIDSCLDCGYQGEN